jgi:hypothetical protein
MNRCTTRAGNTVGKGSEAVITTRAEDKFSPALSEVESRGLAYSTARSRDGDHFVFD